ncbi:MAG TPA: hypothetical protein ENJ56_07120, partial [Anaerolineae bacterium]|nr:hypothetical protein [Anaerolineae bacterium]
MTQQRRTYTKEFKQQAVARLHEGKEKAAEIERELAITRGLLSRWGRELAEVETVEPVVEEEIVEIEEIEEVSVEIPTTEPETPPPPPKINLRDPALYVNRELSQIEFNRRVLAESANPRHPLLEQAKFIAIFASNMDEFFMVRVSGLKQQVALGIADLSIDGLTPREQLIAIYRTVTDLVADEMAAYQTIKDKLYAEGVQIRSYDELKPSRKRKLSEYFEREIFPALTPLAFDPTHPFPHISNLSLNLAVVIRDPDTHETRFARVKVPQSLPRIVPLRQIAPDELIQPNKHKFVWIEEVVKANLGRLFPGMEIIDAYPFRITRNNDMEIQEEEADDLLLSIEDNLRLRHFGDVVRLEIDTTMPEAMRAVLMKNFDIGAYDVYTYDGPLALSGLWGLMGITKPELKDDHFFAQQPPALR